MKCLKNRIHSPTITNKNKSETEKPEAEEPEAEEPEIKPKDQES